jgi:hypothetical protein
LQAPQFDPFRLAGKGMILDLVKDENRVGGAREQCSEEQGGEDRKAMHPNRIAEIPRAASKKTRS